MEGTIPGIDRSVDHRAIAARVAGGLLVPSTVDFMFLALAFAVPLGFTSRLFAADGDVGRHIRVGTDILATRALSFRDVYSSTMYGQPFVPYEWLSEVLFAAVHRVGGLAAVAVLTGLVIALTYATVVVFLRWRGVDPFLAFLIGFASAVLGLLHWLARPHLFTPLGAILTLCLLEKPTWWRVGLFLPLFALWANLHGGFIYGLALISLFVAGDLVEFVTCHDEPSRGASAAPSEQFQRSFWLIRARAHLAALAVATVACGINPSGLALFRHVTSFLGDRLLVDRTLEYMSPDFHNPFGQLFLIALLGCVFVLASSSTRPSYPHLFLFILNAAFALYSWRNIPLFAVTALPIVAVMADQSWRRFAWRKRMSAIIANGESQSVSGSWAAIGTAFLILVAVGHGSFAGIQVSSQFDSTHFPVAAVAAARASHLTGRLFNEFTWGGYVLYAWPEQRVFIDGQTDFYGDATTREYLKITELQDGWRNALRDADISTVLIPPTSVLARELVREPGWQTWYIDSTAVILTRTN